MQGTRTENYRCLSPYFAPVRKMLSHAVDVTVQSHPPSISRARPGSKTGVCTSPHSRAHRLTCPREDGHGPDVPRLVELRVGLSVCGGIKSLLFPFLFPSNPRPAFLPALPAQITLLDPSPSSTSTLPVPGLYLGTDRSLLFLPRPRHFVQHPFSKFS